MKATLIALVLLLSAEVSWAVGKARVKFIKGKVTVLPPGKLKAITLKKKDWVLEGSSIVTQPKSFVRLVLQDKTSMNVGPQSKVVLTNLPNSKANVVKLLSGLIKADVKKTKKKKSKNKLIIKTNTAVMGVRGTKFQSTYNPVNKSTSLVTVEGKVAMVKVEKEVEAAQAEKIINTSADVVEVPAGRYSGTMAKVKKATVPVKISPVQYNVIAKTMGSKKRAKDVMKVTKNDISPEGFEDKVTGKVAPRAGGYLDFATGIYVPPPKSAKLDKKTGTFKAKAIGKVNKRTGDYIPPKGLKIDEKKGFVLLASNDQKQNKKLQKKMVALNQSVEKQMVEEEPKVNKTVEEPIKKQKSSWLPKNHIVGIEFLPYSESQEISHDFEQDDYSLKTDGANWMILKWIQVWNEKFSTRIRMGGQGYDLENDGYYIEKFEEEDRSGIFAIGVIYTLNKKWQFTADVADRGKYYAVPRPGPGINNVKEFELHNYSAGSLDLGAIYHWMKLEKWSFNSSVLLQMIGEDKIPVGFFYDASVGYNRLVEEDASFFALSLDTNAEYKWKKNLTVSTKAWFNTETATAESVEYKRRAFGLGVDLLWDI